MVTMVAASCGTAAGRAGKWRISGTRRRAGRDLVRPRPWQTAAVPNTDMWELTVAGGDPQLDERLNAELTAYNVGATGADDERDFTVRVADADGELVAGLSGWTWGTCAGINMVWVRADARRDGWGGRMLEAAERVAVERGCRQLLVSSFTFQAPESPGRPACRWRTPPTSTS
jgi:GNAT superfamily N-acetyltransferase